jgi:hypothetical protein
MISWDLVECNSMATSTCGPPVGQRQAGDREIAAGPGGLVGLVDRHDPKVRGVGQSQRLRGVRSRNPR